MEMDDLEERLRDALALLERRRHEDVVDATAILGRLVDELERERLCAPRVAG